MGFPATTGSGSLISTPTQSDIKNVFATEEACSKQHLTTFVGSMIPAAIKSSYFPVAALYPNFGLSLDRTYIARYIVTLLNSITRCV